MFQLPDASVCVLIHTCKNLDTILKDWGGRTGEGLVLEDRNKKV